MAEQANQYIYSFPLGRPTGQDMLPPSPGTDPDGWGSRICRKERETEMEAGRRGRDRETDTKEEKGEEEI